MQHKIDYLLIIILIGGSIFAYDQYKIKTNKVYIVDMVKVMKLKNDELIRLKKNGTNNDLDKYFSSYSKLLNFTNTYIENLSISTGTIIYSKQAVYGKSIDLTPRIIIELKNRNLL